MHEHLGLHKFRHGKREDEDEIEDDFLLLDKYSNQWSVLMDKGYHGATDVVRAVILKKKQVRVLLSREDEEYNKKLSSDRKLVRNFFGRLDSFWSVCSVKYDWSKGIYDTLFVRSVAFKNYLISLHKLRDEDGDRYNFYRNRLTDIGSSYKRKRAESQEKYKRKRKQRLNIGYRVNILNDYETEETD